jgi:hypothetical protein
MLRRLRERPPAEEELHMESVAVFLTGVAMVWIVFWFVRNDGARSIRDQRGLFRMRVPQEPVTTPPVTTPEEPGRAEPAAGKSAGLQR